MTFYSITSIWHFISISFESLWSSDVTEVLATCRRRHIFEYFIKPWRKNVKESIRYPFSTVNHEILLLNRIQYSLDNSSNSLRANSSVGLIYIPIPQVKSFDSYNSSNNLTRRFLQSRECLTRYRKSIVILFT